MPIFGGGIFGGSGGGEAGPTGTIPVSKLLYAAMRKAGITLGPQRTPSPDQFQDALEECNRMIGGWNCERPRIYTVRIDQLALTTAKTYTIGIDPAGQVIADWDVPRPQEIIRANVLFPTVPVVRRQVKLLDDEQFSEITLQDIANGVPFEMYNDGAYPFSNISVVPQAIPSYFLELYSWQSIPKFATKDDTVTLPDGYEAAIVDNLACLLYPMFQKGEPGPSLMRSAQRSLAALASKNLPGAPKISAAVPRSNNRPTFNYLEGM